MYYLIDGYNFLFRIESSPSQSLEQRRKLLIELISEELGPLKGQVAIIFDSTEQERDVQQLSIAAPNLEIIYTPRRQTADNYILELADQARHPKEITVVTSDQGLTKQCQHIGTRTMTIEDFITFATKKKKKKTAVKPNYKESKKEFERLRKIFEERLDSNRESQSD